MKQPKNFTRILTAIAAFCGISVNPSCAQGKNHSKDNKVDSTNQEKLKAGLSAKDSVNLSRQIISAKESAKKATEKEGYPKTVADREKVFNALDRAGKAVEALEKNGFMDPATAEVERWEIDNIHSSANRMTTEEKNQPQPTCYAPMPSWETMAASESLYRLKNRLPLLEKLVAARTLSNEATKTILNSLQGDIQILSARYFTGNYDSAQQKEMQAIHDSTLALVNLIERKPEIKTVAVCEQPVWKRIEENWKVVRPVLAGGSFRAKERDRIVVALLAIQKDLNLFTATGQEIPADLGLFEGIVFGCRSIVENVNMQAGSAQELKLEWSSLNLIRGSGHNLFALLQYFATTGRFEKPVLHKSIDFIACMLKEKPDAEKIYQSDPEYVVKISKKEMESIVAELRKRCE
jgi:hypothetical protein